MFNQSTKNHLFSNNLLLVGLACGLLTFVIFCEYFHNELECDIHLFLTGQSSFKKTLFIYSILLFFIANLTFSFLRRQNFSLTDVFSPFSLICLWFRQFIFKIYNPILEAFRRGIIHSQIYNFSVVSN